MSLKASGEEKLLKLGPLGSDTRGSSFDHGAHSSIRQVVISYTPKYLCSIQIQYDIDDYGSSVWSTKLGSSYGGSDAKVYTIKLDYPNEYLVSVRGRLDSLWWSSLAIFVSSITFRSNKNTYGPYGDKYSGGAHFSFHESDNYMIVGFHGRAHNSDKGINAIGAYLKPIDRHSQNRNFIPCDKDNKQVITVAGNHIMENKGKDIGAIRAYEKPPKVKNFIPCDEYNHLIRNKEYNHFIRNKGKDIGAKGAYQKPIDRHSQNEDNKQVITIDGNHVMGNEGKNNGVFVVGNTITNNITQYYSEKPSIV